MFKGAEGTKRERVRVYESWRQKDCFSSLNDHQKISKFRVLHVGRLSAAPPNQISRQAGEYSTLRA